MKHTIPKLFHIQPRNHFYRRFFISYLLILVVPLCAFPVFYRCSYNEILDQETTIRSILAEESSSKVDEVLQNINQFFLTLEQNTSLPTLLYMKEQPGYGSQDAYQVYKAQKEMVTLLEYSRFNYDFSLFIRDADLVFNTNTFTYGIERFYSLKTYYEGIDYETFQDEVLNAPYGQKTIPNVRMVSTRNTSSPPSYRKEDGILYLVSLPIVEGSVSNKRGVAAIHLNEDLLNTLDSVPVTPHGCTYIEDAEQNLIYGVFGESSDGVPPALTFDHLSGSQIQNVNGSPCLITYVTSHYNKWRYVSVSPVHELATNLIFIRNLFFIIYFLVILIGLMLCFYFTHKSSMPLKNILVSLQKGNPQAPELDSYAALEQYIQRSLSDNSKANTLLEEQRNRLIHNFYERLMNGQFSSQEELTSNSNYLGIRLNAKMYGFLLVSFGSTEEAETDYMEQSISQVYAKQLAFPDLKFRIHTHFLSMDQLGIFLMFPEGDPEHNLELLKSDFEPAFYDAFRKFSAEVRCCCGRLYIDPLNLTLSYNEARLTMTQALSRPPQYTICFYEDMPPEPTFYYYPTAVETKLKGLVGSKNVDGVNELLDMIFEENLVKRQLPDYVLNAFFTDMRTGLIRIMRELKLSIPMNLFPSHHHVSNPSMECEQIRVSYQHLIEGLTPSPEENDTPRRIETYLEAHYGDSLLSVVTVAEEFHMSSSYFSTYFKKHMDVTFSKYLENLRISKACELIKNTDKNIEVIAAEVGYSSSLSFRRAFKKVMGIPPSSYR